MAPESSEINNGANAQHADGTPPAPSAPLEAAQRDAATPAGAATDARSALTPADATGGRWLHPPHVAHVRSEIENQIRKKPGRALLVALGVGYVIGRILRGKRDT